MDIQIRKQLEQLEYIKDKLEYIEYSESLQCYAEKLNGIPTGVAAWVNGAFYGFEQAAKAQAVPDGFVVVPKEPTEAMHQAGQDMVTFGGGYDDIYGAMIEAQEPAND